MKYTNGQSSQQSSFLLNSQPTYAANPHRPLPKPLLSYLFDDYHQNHAYQQPPAEVPPLSQDQSVPATQPACVQSSSKSKPVQARQRVKTDISQDGGCTETLEDLRLQNKLLRQRILEYDKKVVGLESVQMEAEYLAKLSLLQQSEIQKLRRMLRQTNYHQLERPNNCKSEQHQQWEGNRSSVSGDFFKPTRGKNKQNCTRNYSQHNQKKGQKRRGSFTRQPSCHNKTTSEWGTADNSSASHCKAAIKKNGSRPFQQKVLFRY